MITDQITDKHIEEIASVLFCLEQWKDSNGKQSFHRSQLFMKIVFVSAHYQTLIFRLGLNDEEARVYLDTVTELRNLIFWQLETDTGVDGEGLDNAYYYMVAIGLEQPQLYSQVTEVLLEMRKAFGSS